MECPQLETRLRGIIEKEIDLALREDYLNTTSKKLEYFKPLIKSKEDAMFGHIISSIESTVLHHTLALYKREPTYAEIEEVAKIILRRASEIRSKILMVTSK